MQKKASSHAVRAEADAIETPLTGEITGLLQAWNAGDEQALKQLADLVYPDLRRAAHKYMRGERPSHTLQTTALVHEGLSSIVWRTTRELAESCSLSLCLRALDAPRTD